MSAALRERTGTVLVVDDEADIRTLVRLVLEREDYRVLEAGDGQAALDAIADHDVDLVLLDLRMAPVDGWQVLRRLRDEGALDRLPVLVVSAHAGPSAVREALELGCRGVLGKPFAARELLEAMHDLTDGAEGS